MLLCYVNGGLYAEIIFQRCVDDEDIVSLADQHPFCIPHGGHVRDISVLRAGEHILHHGGHLV